MILDKHWWRTNDGRLVPDGDPAAATLAYPRGHEVPDHLAEQIGLKAAVEADRQPEPQRDDEQADEKPGDGDQPADDEPADEKQAEDPTDKMTRRAADKSGRPRRTG